MTEETKRPNRIEIGLPFKEQDYIRYKGNQTRWRIVAIFEKGNYLVLANGNTPKQEYIDRLIEKIDAGEAKVIS